MKYTITFPQIKRHELTVNLSFHAHDRQSTMLKLPAWRPGRYELAHYAARIRDLRVNGKRGGYIKSSHSSWLIYHEPHQQVTITYQYYAHIFDAGNSWVDDQLVYLNPINFTLYSEEHRNEDHIIEVLFPTGLSQTESQKTYSSYDDLIDEPVLATHPDNFREISMEIHEKRFSVQFFGDVDAIPARLEQDFRAFIETTYALMQSFPFTEYIFYILCPEYSFYHGVEHKNNNVVVLGPDKQVFTSRYDDLIGVACHELFHAWNVCRLKPKELIQPDYSKEVFTTSGWVLEGLTTYYGEYLLARSGFFTPEKFVNQLNRWLKIVALNPGYHDFSMQEASVDLWMDGYRKPAPWKKPGIYIKGALIWMLADWTFRQNGKRLDDWFRDFYREFLPTGYTDQDIRESWKAFCPGAEAIYDQYVVSADQNIVGDIVRNAGDFGLKIGFAYDHDSITHKLGILHRDNKIEYLHEDSPVAAPHGSEIKSDGDMVAIGNSEFRLNEFSDRFFVIPVASVHDALKYKKWIQ